jgi:hypothetical protein
LISAPLAVEAAIPQIRVRREDFIGDQILSADSQKAVAKIHPVRESLFEMVGRSSSLIALGISENGFSSATFTECPRARHHRQLTRLRPISNEMSASVYKSNPPSRITGDPDRTRKLG